MPSPRSLRAGSDSASCRAPARRTFASFRSSASMPEKLAQQLRNDSRGSLKCRFDLGLILAPGFRDLRLATAGTTHEFGDCSDQLARLNALDEPRRNPGDNGNLAFGLSRGKHHHTLAQFLLQIVDQRAKLTAFEIVCAVRQHLHAL